MADVTILDSWVQDISYSTTEDADFAISAGADRVAIVCISRESNAGQAMGISGVSIGDQDCVQVGSDLLVGSTTAYHNLNSVWILGEAEIAAMTGNTITITWTGSPNNPFDEAKIFYASYENFDSIGDVGVNTSTSATTLDAASVTSVDGDKLIGFNVVGQHFAPDITQSGWTVHSTHTGVTNGHSACVGSRDAVTAVTESVTMTSASATRMAVRAFVLQAVPSNVIASGGGTIAPLEAAGTAKVHKKASGAAILASVTASGAAKVVRKASGGATLAALVAEGSAHLAPRVYLNTTQTLGGATEMTVTAHNIAGTSITFTDPVGAPTGALFLGVENRANGDVGWIAVTVNSTGPTASGAAILTAVVASGAAIKRVPASGAATLAPVIAAGTATVRRTASGAATLTPVTASGDAKRRVPASGAAALLPITAAGAAKRRFGVSGAATLVPITAAGAAKRRFVVSGAATLAPVTASGDATKRVSASGSATLAPMTGSGVASLPGEPQAASGAATLAPVTASGAAIVRRKASGSATLAPVTASGAATKRVPASGSATLAPVTGSGTAEVVPEIPTASGAATLAPVTAAGTATVRRRASGSATLAAIQAAGTAKRHSVASGNASLLPVTGDGASKLVRSASGAATLASMIGEATARVVHKASGVGILTSPFGEGSTIVGGATIIDYEDLEAREIAVELEARYHSDIDLNARGFAQYLTAGTGDAWPLWEDLPAPHNAFDDGFSEGFE